MAAARQGAQALTDHHRAPPGWRARWRLVLAAIAAGAATSACSAGPGGLPVPQPVPQPADHPAASPAAVSPSAATPTAAHADHGADPGRQAPLASARPLAGKIVGIDPGHNGGNFTDASYIGHPIWNGREWEACDTTGTETDGGYTEAQFNFSVARYLRDDLRRDGAAVVMTRASNDGVGPCVDRRAEIINGAHADVAVDIHADGGPAWGRGFTVLEPVGVGPNDAVIASSQQFGSDVRQAFLAGVPTMPESTYTGSQGLMERDDLAGLNLTRVPKVLIECGNMRNDTDARLLVSASFQQQVARALAAAIIVFLRAG
jgi:N-acetylmuramoyl-L-alanine amidase